MYGSATLAIVVSSACMIVAVMAQIVTMFRRRPGTAADGAPVVIALFVVLVRYRRRHAEQGRQRAAMVGVDRGIDAHAGLQFANKLVVLVEIDSHRDALHYLDEIARRILRRQDRELRAGAGRERPDRALEHMIGEGIDLDRNGLPDRDIGEIRLF